MSLFVFDSADVWFVLELDNWRRNGTRSSRKTSISEKKEIIKVILNSLTLYVYLI